MANVALKLLKLLERSGDASLEEIAALIPKVHGDHRDFYVLASLVARGLVETPFLSESGCPKPATDSKVQVLSWKLFAMSTADEKAKYKNMSWLISGNGETLKGQRFALSGAGYLYLIDRSTKRTDRFVAIGSGILVGIVVAVAGALIGQMLKEPNPMLQWTVSPPAKLER